MKKIKLTAWALVLLLGVQSTGCKSKEKKNTETTQTAPLPDTTMNNMPPPVETASDATLQTGLRDATKDYPGVQASVSEGEVTLSGSITRDRLPNLMAAVSSLHPKKINKQQLIIK